VYQTILYKYLNITNPIAHYTRSTTAVVPTNILNYISTNITIGRYILTSTIYNNNDLIYSDLLVMEVCSMAIYYIQSESQNIFAF